MMEWSAKDIMRHQESLDVQIWQYPATHNAFFSLTRDDPVQDFELYDITMQGIIETSMVELGKPSGARPVTAYFKASPAKKVR